MLNPKVEKHEMPKAIEDALSEIYETGHLCCSKCGKELAVTRIIRHYHQGKVYPCYYIWFSDDDNNVRSVKPTDYLAVQIKHQVRQHTINCKS